IDNVACLFHTLSLHDALPIYVDVDLAQHPIVDLLDSCDPWLAYTNLQKCTDELRWLCWRLKQFYEVHLGIRVHTMSALSWINSIDRKSTRLNSSHVKISYAVF